MLSNILSQSAFLMVNKTIAKKVGINAALLLSYLIGKEAYHAAREEFFFSEKIQRYVFYAKSADIEDEVCLSYKQQINVIKTLADAGLIEVVLMGIPATNHFCVNENAVFELILGGKQDMTKGKNLNCQKVRTNIIILDNEIKLNNNNNGEYFFEKKENEPPAFVQTARAEITPFERKNKGKELPAPRTYNRIDVDTLFLAQGDAFIRNLCKTLSTTEVVFKEVFCVFLENKATKMYESPDHVWNDFKFLAINKTAEAESLKKIALQNLALLEKKSQKTSVKPPPEEYSKIFAK